jgi:proline iminopeptidase
VQNRSSPCTERFPASRPALGLIALLFGLATTLPAARAQTTGTVPAEGVELYYHTYGDPEGEPILILNGGPGVSSEHFADLARRVGALGPGYRTILFDQRGTGRSPLKVVESSTVTVEHMVADIEALREHLGIQRWVVMGHSWGGMYAMLYAVQHPGRLQGLILSASGGADLSWLSYVGNSIRMQMGAERRAVYDRTFEPDYLARHPDRAQRERVEAMAAAYVFQPEHIPAVVEALTRPGANFPAVRGLVYADLRRNGYDLHDDLSVVEAPALIIHGRQDILGEEIPLRIQAALPRAELLFVDRSSHYLWMDRPDVYFTALERFLEGVTAREG